MAVKRECIIIVQANTRKTVYFIDVDLFHGMSLSFQQLSF